MPTIKDDENNPVKIAHTLPAFIKFDEAEKTYIIKAVNPALHIGNFMVKGELSDSRIVKPF